MRGALVIAVWLIGGFTAGLVLSELDEMRRDAETLEVGCPKVEVIYRDVNLVKNCWFGEGVENCTFSSWYEVDREIRSLKQSENLARAILRSRE